MLFVYVLLKSGFYLLQRLSAKIKRMWRDDFCAPIGIKTTLPQKQRKMTRVVIQCLCRGGSVACPEWTCGTTAPTGQNGERAMTNGNFTERISMSSRDKSQTKNDAAIFPATPWCPTAWVAGSITSSIQAVARC